MIPSIFYKRKTSCLLIGICLFLPFKGIFCQNISEYPVSNFSIYQNQTIYNPAPVLNDKTGEISVLYQGRNGVFSDVNAMFFSGTVVSNKRHLLGAFVMTENESEFLRKARYYGKYALRINLSKKTHLISGIMAGVASYQFSSSLSGTGGGNTRFDAGLGLAFVSGRFSLGINMLQAPESHVRPLVYDYLLKRYYVLMGRYKQNVSKNISLMYLVESRCYLDRENVIRLSLAGQLYDKVIAGLQGDNLGSASFYGGLQILVHEKTTFDLQFNYVMQNLYNKNRYRLNIYEVSFRANF